MEFEIRILGQGKDDFPPRALEKVATAVRVLDRLNLPGGTIQTTLQGLRRIRLTDAGRSDACPPRNGLSATYRAHFS